MQFPFIQIWKEIRKHNFHSSGLQIIYFIQNAQLCVRNLFWIIWNRIENKAHTSAHTLLPCWPPRRNSPTHHIWVRLAFAIFLPLIFAFIRWALHAGCMRDKKVNYKQQMLLYYIWHFFVANAAWDVAVANDIWKIRIYIGIYKIQTNISDMLSAYANIFYL